MDAARIVHADEDAGNWLTHGRTYSEQRFSPLTGISTANVGQLGLAWSLDLDTTRGQEATPLVIDGVMYSTSAWSKVQAIDASTGKLLWQYDPRVPGEYAAKACCDVVNRGLAAWDGRLFVGTLDGRLVALDAATGTEVWSVVTVDQTKAYTITGAPRIVKGKVIIGNGGAEFGVRGYISAYDTRDGKQLWRFYTVPGDPSLGFEQPVLAEAAKTWKGEWWRLGGGGTVWDSMAYDPELDLLYFGTGNGSPWNQKIRSPGGGDNLFLSSIVAVHPDTGEYVWHYQTTPGESWDYTATQHIVLADVSIGGETRKVLLQAPKNGFFYVLDRVTGKLISAEKYGAVNWASGVDLATGRPVENPDARYPDPEKPWFALPGALGAHNWHPMSFSPQTGLIYIPANDLMYAYIDRPQFKASPVSFNTGVDPTRTRMLKPDKSAPAAPVRGLLRAWDPIAQKEAWSVEHPGPWNGGVLSTAGGLVFQGNAVGLFNAYDARNGKLLWSAAAQTGIVAAPITYRVKDEQFVAVVVGWGGVYPNVAGEAARKGSLAVNRSRVLAFKLGGVGSLPDPAPAATFTAVPRVGDDAAAAVGFRLFHDHCSRCHGAGAVSGGVIPDLRWSAFARDGDAWKSVVLGGALKDRGMISFSSVIGEADAEALRAYVTQRSNQSTP
ncbi:PQQ-dependent dehydrogenase, methanol/ethanol family [Steroidobacter sp.]|uniref:PQQ-dependent dehydrogenase, methanol/ethanol family n=1 Tax=Steroidobacter sp. TaxID=1978227 RepID=UPI001A492F14|nr:PQQ-dependent dehydrogenase, methanol/ethanol family [Steroidobacter sp.]MBL8270626.1 PQQ-dependent dehydrogenase, methanol/ethanol family [Steroidobacter sp.]